MAVRDMSITIVGLGLVGGSFAMALKKLNPKNLWAVEVDEDSIMTAQKRGIIDRGYLRPDIPLRRSDLVIICLYPDAVVSFVKDNMEHFRKGAVITDTAGIKSALVQSINPLLREDLDFVAGHPLAGREYKGLEFASDAEFAGASYVITPTARNRKMSLGMVEDMAREIGFAKVVRLSPAEHDEIIAMTSQLPHVIAAALVNSACGRKVGPLAAGSYRDTTRVARINSRLWTELLLGNRQNILAIIDSFEANVAGIKKAIKDGRREELTTILEEVRSRREEI
jgi:prephenate dehydrogenase